MTDDIQNKLHVSCVKLKRARESDSVLNLQGLGQQSNNILDRQYIRPQPDLAIELDNDIGINGSE